MKFKSNKSKMKKEQIILSIGEILLQVKKIAEKREFGMGIASAYFIGGTLCIDIRENGLPAFTVMVNINGEEFNVVEHKNLKEDKRLLSIKALRLAFEIYKIKKGETEYYTECFEKSCLRHFVNL